MNLAIIGCGATGSAYAQAAQGLGLTVVVCADPVESRARKLARSSGAKASNRCLSAAKRKDVDTVIIASPTDTHAKYMVAAADAGKKIACETPLAGTIADARRALRAVRRAKTTLLPAHRAFAAPQFAGIDDRIANGAIGEPGFIHIHRAEPTTKSSASHVAFDVLAEDYAWLARRFAPPAKVFCQAIERSKVQYAMVTITLRSGVIAQLVASRTKDAPSRHAVEICGSGGMIQFDSLDVPNTVTKRAPGTRRSTSHSPIDPTEETRLLEKLIAGPVPCADTDAALQAVRIGAAAVKSAESGRPVRL